ncbi:MAG TPA: hypothetical protein VI455_07735 [Terriglobia bacterium]
MKTTVLTLVAVFMLVLFSTISVIAKGQPAEGPQDQAAPAASDSEAKPAKSASMGAAKAETLSGTISSVDAEKKLVVVSGPNGVPYNFAVSNGTKITVGGSKAKLSDLQTGKQASVSFVPEKKRGNLAKSIEVT